jgi:hypothetical protein
MHAEWENGRRRPDQRGHQHGDQDAALQAQGSGGLREQIRSFVE